MAFQFHIRILDHAEIGFNGFVVGDAIRIHAFDNAFDPLRKFYFCLFGHFEIPNFNDGGIGAD